LNIYILHIAMKLKMIDTIDIILIRKPEK